jgi:hypothetical protein
MTCRMKTRVISPAVSNDNFGSCTYTCNMLYMTFCALAHLLPLFILLSAIEYNHLFSRILHHRPYTGSIGIGHSIRARLLSLSLV